MISSHALLFMALLWNCNDLLRFWFWFRFGVWKNFGSGSGSSSGSRQYLAQFSNNKKFVQNLAFSMSEAAIFPRKLASHF
jgi:hypothetical protein